MTEPMSDRCPVPNCGGDWIEIDGGPSGYCRRCGLPEKHWPAVQALKDELERCKARIAELEESDVGRLCKTANAMIVERDHEIARLKAELAAVQSICAWCGRFEYEHGEPGASEYAKAQGSLTWRLCPVVGVTSQFFTARKQLTQAEPRPEGDANDRD